MEMLTYETVEAAVKTRVEMKAKTYGVEVRINQEEDTADPVYKIKPSLVSKLYGDWIMPLTKEVQVEYLLRRLDQTSAGILISVFALFEQKPAFVFTWMGNCLECAGMNRI